MLRLRARLRSKPDDDSKHRRCVTTCTTRYGVSVHVAGGRVARQRDSSHRESSSDVGRTRGVPVGERCVAQPAWSGAAGCGPPETHSFGRSRPARSSRVRHGPWSNAARDAAAPDKTYTAQRREARSLARPADSKRDTTHDAAQPYPASCDRCDIQRPCTNLTCTRRRRNFLCSRSPYQRSSESRGTEPVCSAPAEGGSDRL